MTTASAAFLLFLVMDPLGNIPFFLPALAACEPHRRNRVELRELLIAFAVMIAFLFAGAQLLRLLAVTEPALTLAGRGVVFLIPLQIAFSTPEPSVAVHSEGGPS